MKTTTNKAQSVTLGTKGNSKARKPARRLADEPAMKELARMLDAGEVNHKRTLEHLKKIGRKA